VAVSWDCRERGVGELASWRVGDTRSVVVVVVVDTIADCAARLNSPRATEHAAESFGHLGWRFFVTI